jgi:enoyl-CoA hydratase
MKTVEFFLNEQKTHLKFHINRPKALNAINFEVMDDLNELMDLAEALSLQVFELQTHSIGYIASGGDLKEFSSLYTEQEGLEMAQKMAKILNRIENLPCLTVATINGKAFGGGCEFLLAFDLLYATEKAQLGFTQIKFGLPPGWNGMFRLVNKIGYQRALHILLNAKILNGKEAKSLGIIAELFDDEAGISHQIEHFKTIPLAVLKRIKENAALIKNKDYSSTELKKLELQNFAKAWGAKEHHEAVEQFFKSRT